MQLILYRNCLLAEQHVEKYLNDCKEELWHILLFIYICFPNWQYDSHTHSVTFMKKFGITCISLTRKFKKEMLKEGISYPFTIMGTKLR